MLWLICGLVSGLYLVYIYLTWHHDYWTKRGIPHLKASVPFGNIGDIVFSRKIIGQLYHEIYNQFEGEPWCGFYKMRQPILMVREPDLVRTVLVKEFASFHDNDFHFNPKADPIFALNPFVARGAEWKEYRGVLAPTQTPAKARTMVPHCQAVCHNMIEFLHSHAGQYLEVMEVMGHFTTDASASWGLSVNSNSFKNPEARFRREATDVFGGDFTSNLAIVLSFYAPVLGDILGFRMIRKSFVDYFTGVIKEVLDLRKSSEEQQKDFIQLLLDNTDRGKGEGWNEMEVTGHCLTFIMEGYLNTMATLSYCLHELGLHPEVQERARQEVCLTFSSVDDFDHDKLMSLTYLSQVIEETVRMHPAVPMITRVCNRGMVLESGGQLLKVEPGMSVCVPVLALHHDHKYWPNPEQFDPSRFSGEAKANRNRFLFLGFSDGPRACIGSKVAQMYLRTALSAILLNFRVEPKDPNAKIVPDPTSSFVLLAKGGVWAKFTPL